MTVAASARARADRFELVGSGEAVALGGLAVLVGLLSLALLAALSFLLAFGRYADTDSRRWLVASGVAAGLVTLTRPGFTTAVFFAAAVGLAMRARAGGGRREAAVIAVAALGIPAASTGVRSG
jgi:hypothetical protein